MASEAGHKKNMEKGDEKLLSKKQLLHCDYPHIPCMRYKGLLSLSLSLLLSCTLFLAVVEIYTLPHINHTHMYTCTYVHPCSHIHIHVQTDFTMECSISLNHPLCIRRGREQDQSWEQQQQKQHYITTQPTYVTLLHQWLATANTECVLVHSEVTNCTQQKQIVVTLPLVAFYGTSQTLAPLYMYVPLSVDPPLLTTSTLGSVEYHHGYQHIRSIHQYSREMTRIQNKKQNLNHKQLSQSYLHSLHLDQHRR